MNKYPQDRDPQYIHSNTYTITELESLLRKLICLNFLDIIGILMYFNLKFNVSIPNLFVNIKICNFFH